jgi:hypothetical protein
MIKPYSNISGESIIKSIEMCVGNDIIYKKVYCKRCNTFHEITNKHFFCSICKFHHELNESCIVALVKHDLYIKTK